MSCTADYDARFASRFSTEDAEFQRYRERAPDAPPVLEDWRAARARRDRRAPDRRQYEARGRHSGHSGHYGHRSHY